MSCSFLHSCRKQFSLSYREQSEESRRSCAAKRRIQWSRLVDPDHQAQFGPPDKSKNFCSSSTKKQEQCTTTKAKKRRHCYVDSSDSDSDTIVLPQTIKKKKSTQSAAFAGIGQRVEVRYDDGVWYKVTWANFDISSGQWKVEFDDDDEETDADVHVV